MPYPQSQSPAGEYPYAPVTGATQVDEDLGYLFHRPDYGEYYDDLGRAISTAGAYRAAAQAGGYGRAAYMRGMRETAASLAAQAAMRGPSAAGQRAALYGAGEAKRAAGARMQELQHTEQLAAYQQLADALRQQSAEQLAIREQELAQQEMESQHYAALTGNVQAAAGQQQQLYGAGASAAGTLLAAGLASDERLKAGISEASPRAQDEVLRALDRTADGLDLSRFEYSQQAQRDYGLPPGRRLGLMAQELERTPLGRQAVIETPAGKAIDRDSALGLALALHGRQAERQDTIEQRMDALERRLRRR